MKKLPKTIRLFGCTYVLASEYDDWLDQKKKKRNEDKDEEELIRRWQAARAALRLKILNFDKYETTVGDDGVKHKTLVETNKSLKKKYEKLLQELTLTKFEEMEQSKTPLFQEEGHKMIVPVVNPTPAPSSERVKTIALPPDRLAVDPKLNQKSTSKKMLWHSKKLRMTNWSLKIFDGTAANMPPSAIYANRNFKGDRITIERRDGIWRRSGKNGKLPWRIVKWQDGQIVSDVSYVSKEVAEKAVIIAIKELEKWRKDYGKLKGVTVEVKVNRRRFTFSPEKVKRIRMVLKRGRKYIVWYKDQEKYAIKAGKPASVGKVGLGDTTPVFIPLIKAWMRLVFEDEHMTAKERAEARGGDDAESSEE